MANEKEDVTRREFLRTGLCGAGVAVLGSAVGLLARRASAGSTLWQIDPDKCVQCGRCANECVLGVSAVKCVHAYAMCGYCDRCTGFFEPEPAAFDTGAENQLCPVGAIKRSFIEDPYYEYIIDDNLCYGCGKCVKGCEKFGNGSLFLQIRQDLCVKCNQCAIALACPGQAIIRVPADRPYLLKNRGETS